MNDFASRLFSNISSKPQSAVPPSHILSLRTSPKDPNLTIIHPAGYPSDAPPLRSVVGTPAAKPNVVIFRGEPHVSSNIGQASFHSISSTIDLSLHGQSICMKMSQLSGNFSLEYPPRTKLTWSVNKFTGSGLGLCDSSGYKLAELNSSGLGGKKLEILVSCDEFFFDLVLLSAMAAKVLIKVMMDAALEVVWEAAG
jgi:hypothetical protein